MSTIVVRYRTQSDRSDENQELIESVFAELHEKDPGGLRYMAFRLEDGTFVHVADVQADPNPLSQVGAFGTFQSEIADRCEPGEGPNPQQATLVGAYGYDV